MKKIVNSLILDDTQNIGDHHAISTDYELTENPSMKTIYQQNKTTRATINWEDSEQVDIYNEKVKKHYLS